jgi:hypothetical protein
MLNINSLISGTTLNSQQADVIRNSYEALSPEKKALFSNNDFENLLVANGYHNSQSGFNAGNNTGNRPELPSPSIDTLDVSSFEGMASLGAAVMALITKNASEQRQENKDIVAQRSDNVVNEIQNQAKEMKKKAIVQLILNIVSGAISIASGIAGVKGATKAMASGLKGEQLALANTKITSYQTSISGLGSIVGAVSQFYGGLSDSNVKEMDANIEREKASIEFLKQCNDSLSELIQKSLATAQAIQESTNQARSKILG